MKKRGSMFFWNVRMKSDGNAMKKLITIIIVLLSIIPIYAVYADIYKYVDNEGVEHLTNFPSDRNAKYVSTLRENQIPTQPNIPISDENKYDDIIIKAAEKFKLDSTLIKAIIKAGSNFNPQAVSSIGAKGLMQLMPETASTLKVEDSFNPEKNIEGGARYLRYLLNTYKGDLTLALAAYYAGEKAVAKYNYNVPPYRETQNYVKRVYSFYDSYRSTNTR